MNGAPCGCGGGPLCGCCEGIEASTPISTVNRPGLDALRYRVGTHATFYETMVAHLSSHRLADGRRPLKRLTSREPDDPSLAFLDAWATVADVLTFYQERIANEGYLLTATERRSVIELGRLVGYRPRPGVASSVYLAFTLEDDAEVEVPAGTRARSLPGPGELPQTFETDEALPARSEWNALAPRLTRPAVIRADADFVGIRTLWLEGAATDLEIGDPLLLRCGATARAYTVRDVEPDRAAGHTRIAYAPLGAAFSESPSHDPDVIGADDGVTPATSPLARLTTMVEALRQEPSLPPASRFQLARTPERTYSAAGDLGPQLLVHFEPRVADTLYAAYASAPPPRTPDAPAACAIEALRVTAAVYGHNVPPPDNGGTPPVEIFLSAAPSAASASAASASADLSRILPLDAVYEGITPGSWIAVDPGGDAGEVLVTRVEQVRTRTRADAGVSIRVTELVLRDAWTSTEGPSLDAVRGTTVHALGEALAFADAPIEDAVEGDTLELDRLYDGLEAGRWLVIRGERADVRDANGQVVEGIEASELVMLAGVVHDGPAENGGGVADDPTDDGENPDDADNGEARVADTLHTRLILSEPLAYAYRRDTVTINANVVRATHGETHEEVLGAGDAARSFQHFTLAQAPLTHVSAPTPSGIASTLEVRVERVRWPERDTLLHLGPSERGYTTRADDEGATTIVFGDGRRGARLPTGSDNVTAVYRSGIGTPGNVDAARVTLLATRPLGVVEVTNPQRASGGADPETRDQARRNVPLAVRALDRLVSVPDYADFARTFAGIGKASAVQLSDGRRTLVHLTVAGAADTPIDRGSDLHRNLTSALTRFGDPSTPLHVAPREMVVVLLAAGVQVHEDHRWDDLEPVLRAKLLDTFGFERRELGQGIFLSEVIAAAQGVPGVDRVDVDVLTGVSASDALDPAALGERLESLAASAASAAPPNAPACDRPRLHVAAEAARVDASEHDPARRIRPAQLAYLNAELPDTLILTEITP